jgi:predicted phage terminase large subunit-like protein
VLAPRDEVPARHHLALIAALERLEQTPGGRLMVLMPPGAAKSTYASILFPAWWLARHRRGAVVAACHTAALAEHFGRQVRALLDEHGARLGTECSPEKRAAGQFLLKNGGNYYAIGVHGAVTGRRADLAIIDDPVIGFSQAESFSQREQLWAWYRSELVTRLRPGGKTLLVMTRWHSDDIAGRLIEQGGFEVLSFPALATADDGLGRSVGEALWPDYESAEALLEKRRVLGEPHFAALFQQCPVAMSGGVFDARLIRFVDTVPVGVAVRAWDLAATAEKTGDWTVGVRLLRSDNDLYFVDDVVRLRAGPAEVVAALLATAKSDGAEIVVGLPQDPGQAGRAQVSYLTAQLAGFVVRSSPEKDTKVVRAMALASQITTGNVAVRRAPWTAAFLDEIALFPGGEHDDQVDAFTRAFAMLQGNTKPLKVLRSLGLGR